MQDRSGVLGKSPARRSRSGSRYSWGLDLRESLSFDDDLGWMRRMMVGLRDRDRWRSRGSASLQDLE